MEYLFEIMLKTIVVTHLSQKSRGHIIIGSIKRDTSEGSGVGIYLRNKTNNCLNITQIIWYEKVSANALL